MSAQGTDLPPGHGLPGSAMSSASYMDASADDSLNHYVHSDSLPATYGSMMHGVDMQSPFVDPALAAMDMTSSSQYPMPPAPLVQSSAEGQNAMNSTEPFANHQQVLPQAQTAQGQPQSNGTSLRDAATGDGSLSVQGSRTPVDDSATNDSASQGSEDSQAANIEAMSQPAAGGTRRDDEREARGGEYAAIQRERETIRWTPETRFELLLQVAYERRHESVSEGAWHRIAEGSRGGLWKGASWNGVRLEFSRLMSERFADYASAENARARRAQLDTIAAAQRNGQPSTVTPEHVHPLLTDADFEPPPRRQRRGAADHDAEGDETEERGRPAAPTQRGTARRRGRARRTLRPRGNPTSTTDTAEENTEMGEADAAIGSGSAQTNGIKLAGTSEA